MVKRKLSVWNVVDEVMTDMSDANWGYWSKDRISFRNALIEEIKHYVADSEDAGEELEVHADLDEDDIIWLYRGGK